MAYIEFQNVWTEWDLWNYLRQSYFVDRMLRPWELKCLSPTKSPAGVLINQDPPQWAGFHIWTPFSKAPTFLPWSQLIWTSGLVGLVNNTIATFSRDDSRSRGSVPGSGDGEPEPRSSHSVTCSKTNLGGWCLHSHHLVSETVDSVLERGK